MCSDNQHITATATNQAMHKYKKHFLKNALMNWNIEP